MKKIFSFVIAIMFLSTNITFADDINNLSLVQRVSKLEEENINLKKMILRIMHSQAHSGNSLVQTVKNIQNSVVSIIESKDLTFYKNNSSNDPVLNEFLQEFYGVKLQTETKHVQVGGGSGFIYSSDGYIITNNHVVEDTSADYTVVLFDGSQLKASIVYRNPNADVAIVKVKTSTALQAIPLGDSSKIEVGEEVIAIGNALGQFQNTVTTGVISATKRSVTASTGSGSEEIQGLFQTDAAINPGNSGGPLLNLDGEVIAMNTAIVQGAAGIGFAIPINDIKKAVIDAKIQK